MKYSIQGNEVDTCPTVTPSMYVTCRACNTAHWTIGEDLPVEDYSLILSYDDIENAMDQRLDKLGWVDLICPTCISNDPNIVKTYNDSEDRHEQD